MSASVLLLLSVLFYCQLISFGNIFAVVNNTLQKVFAIPFLSIVFEK